MSFVQVFNLDPGSVTELFLELRTRVCQDTDTSVDSAPPPVKLGDVNGSAEPEARHMWAMIEVGVGRRYGW